MQWLVTGLIISFWYVRVMNICFHHKLTAVQSFILSDTFKLLKGHPKKRNLCHQVIYFPCRSKPAFEVDCSFGYLLTFNGSEWRFGLSACTYNRCVDIILCTVKLCHTVPIMIRFLWIIVDEPQFSTFMPFSYIKACKEGCSLR